MLSREIAVELGVVSHNNSITHEGRQLRESLGGAGGMRHITVVDVCKMGHFFRDRLTGVNERREPLDDFPSFHTSSGNLG